MGVNAQSIRTPHRSATLLRDDIPGEPLGATRSDWCRKGETLKARFLAANEIWQHGLATRYKYG